MSSEQPDGTTATVALTLSIAGNSFACPLSLNTWLDAWWRYGHFETEEVPDPDARIDALLTLWRTPIKGGWQRKKDKRLLGSRYCRGDYLNPRGGEYTLEHEALVKPLSGLSCFAGTVLDGVNAVPLVRASADARNVQADMFLLVEQPSAHLVFVVEVKDKANNAWHAAVENLAQLRLTYESVAARSLFSYRAAHNCFSAQSYIPFRPLPHWGMVLAPTDFYTHKGQKANAVDPARKLLERFREEVGVTVVLAVWTSETRTISRD